MNETLSRQATRAAYGWGRPRDWGDAIDLVRQAAAAGEKGAKRQLDLVTQRPLEDLLEPPPIHPLSPRARIAIAPGFAPPGFAEWLVDHADGRLEPAPVNDAAGTAVRTARTSAYGPDQRDVVLAILQERAARLVGVAMANHEPPNAIHYQPGQEFRDHVDFIEPSVPEFRAELERLGQRVATVVTYLNDGFEGAETAFPDLRLRYRGKPGDAIFWSNVLPDGSPDYTTRHRALAPNAGEKWVLSQWIRSQPYPFAPEDRIA